MKKIRGFLEFCFLLFVVLVVCKCEHDNKRVVQKQENKKAIATLNAHLKDSIILAEKKQIKKQTLDSIYSIRIVKVKKGESLNGKFHMKNDQAEAWAKRYGRKHYYYDDSTKVFVLLREGEDLIWEPRLTDKYDKK